MIFKRMHVAISIGVLTGISTHLFLSGIGPLNGSTRGLYFLYLNRFLIIFMLSLVLSARYLKSSSDRLIKIDKSYEIYKNNRENLINDMKFDDLILLKATLLAAQWGTWASLGVLFGCLFDRVLYGA